MPRDDYLLIFGEVKVLGKLIFHFRQRYLFHRVLRLA
jgi:hypothetical protein